MVLMNMFDFRSGINSNTRMERQRRLESMLATQQPHRLSTVTESGLKKVKERSVRLLIKISFFLFSLAAYSIRSCAMQRLRLLLCAKN